MIVNDKSVAYNGVVVEIFTTQEELRKEILCREPA